MNLSTVRLPDMVNKYNLTLVPLAGNYFHTPFSPSVSDVALPELSSPCFNDDTPHQDDPSHKPNPSPSPLSLTRSPTVSCASSPPASADPSLPTQTLTATSSYLDITKQTSKMCSAKFIKENTKQEVLWNKQDSSRGTGK